MQLLFHVTEATSTDGACEINAQCSAPFVNSECKDNKCKCFDTHVENSRKDKCLKSNNATLLFTNY